MPQVKNWKRDEFQNLGDIKGYSMAGVVRRWVNTETNDKVTIKYIDDDDGRPHRFDVEYNGEAVNAHNSLTEAVDSVMETLRKNPDGL